MLESNRTLDLSNMRKILGNTKRGLIGIFQDKIIRDPKLNKTLIAINLGKSIKGENILCYQIGNGGKKILFASGIHGNEVGTVKLAKHIANWSLKNHSSLEDYTIYVIPCLNPDGYNLALKHPGYFKGGRIGRLNTNNVDLNRNFDTPTFKTKSYWSHGKNYSERTKVYCGEFGESEPEIRCFTKFIKEHNIGTLFVFHNAGQDVLGNRTEKAQKLAKLFAEKSGFKLMKEGQWKKLNQTGTLAEWCDINKINYLEIEGSNRWGSDWKSQKEAIIATMLAS